LIGEGAETIADELERYEVYYEVAGDLPQAVAKARAAAQSGEIVLLSPACASFDQYSDFEARGKHFRSLVKGNSNEA